MDYEDACRIINLSEALNRLDNDSELYRDLLTSFFEDGKFNFQQLEDLVEEGDMQEAGRKIHRLKGAAGTLGADRLCDSCHKAEQLIRQGEIDCTQLQALRTAHDESYEALLVIRAEL